MPPTVMRGVRIVLKSALIFSSFFDDQIVLLQDFFKAWKESFEKFVRSQVFI